jgi:hypothetical protein
MRANSTTDAPLSPLLLLLLTTAVALFMVPAWRNFNESKLDLLKD